MSKTYKHPRTDTWKAKKSSRAKRALKIARDTMRAAQSETVTA